MICLIIIIFINFLIRDTCVQCPVLKIILQKIDAALFT